MYVEASKVINVILPYVSQFLSPNATDKSPTAVIEDQLQLNDKYNVISLQ